MSDERRYSKAELHAIFERAAERQVEARRAESASRGELTLAELQEIGAASGIDPAHVAAAAAELHRAPPDDVHTFLGAPTEVERSRILPGTVSDEAWAQMVAEVRRTFDKDGSIGQIGRMREWTASTRAAGNSGETSTRLTLEPIAGGGTRATLRKSVRETTKGSGIAAAINGAMGLLFFILFVFGVDPELWIPALMMGGIGLAFAAATRGWLNYWGPKQEETFDGVFDRLELIARDAGPEAAPTAASARNTAPEAEAVRGSSPALPERRLDLDRLSDEPEGTSASERRRTRS